MLRNALREQPLKSSAGASARGLQERGGDQRIVWMKRAKRSPCGKEVKEGVNLFPLQKLKGHITLAVC